jgi:uncharacterized protein YlxW (UPF0749 family)
MSVSIILGLGALVAIAIAGYRIQTLERAYRHKERILDDLIQSMNRDHKDMQTKLNDQIKAANRLIKRVDETKMEVERRSAALSLVLAKVAPFADAIDKTY